MRMIFFSVSDIGILGKRNSEFSQLESNLYTTLPITNSDALPLSYRRLVGAFFVREIMFTLIGVVAGPSVQVPLFHSLVNM